MIIVKKQNSEEGLRQLATENVILEEVIIEGKTYYFPKTKMELSKEMTTYSSRKGYGIEKCIQFLNKIFLCYVEGGKKKCICDLETGKEYESDNCYLELKDFDDRIYILDKDEAGEIKRYYNFDAEEWCDLYGRTLKFVYFENKPYIQHIYEDQIKYIYDIIDKKKYWPKSSTNGSNDNEQLQFYKYEGKLYILDVVDGHNLFIYYPYDKGREQVYGELYGYCEFYKHENVTYIIVKDYCDDKIKIVYDIDHDKEYKLAIFVNEFKFYKFENEVFLLEIDEDSGKIRDIYHERVGRIDSYIWDGLQPEFRTFEGTLYIQYVDKNGEVKHIIDYRYPVAITPRRYIGNLDLILFEGKVYIIDVNKDGKTKSICDPETGEWYPVTADN